MITFMRTAITEDDCILAKKILAETPVYNKSHRKEEANQVGVLGEVVARRWLKTMGVKFTPTNTTRHDLRLTEADFTIDVKTKDRTVIPRHDYEASVPLYNHDHQKPDYYLFLSLYRDKGAPNILTKYTHAYVLGAINQLGLHKVGITREAESIDPRNGTQFWTSVINVYHRDLVDPRAAATYWRKLSPYVNGWEDDS